MQSVRPNLAVAGGVVRIGVRTASSAFLSSDLVTTRANIAGSITQYLQATEQRSSLLRLDKLAEYNGETATRDLVLRTKILKHDVTVEVTIALRLQRPVDPIAELELDQLIGPTIASSITAILIRDIKRLRRQGRAAA